MNLFRVSLAGVRARPLETTLNVILLGLGVGTIVLLLLVGSQLDERMKRDARGIDLVVGAKGSPLQLILSAVYQLDIPTGNVSLSEANRLGRNPMIKKIVPISMGDSYGNYRIVGTNADYLGLYGAETAQGRLWQRPMEAVLGATVATQRGLTPGDTFSGAHGLAPGGEEHASAPYTVVGVLKPTGTVVDRLILTDFASVWFVHEHHSDEAEPGAAGDSAHAGRAGHADLADHAGESDHAGGSAHEREPAAPDSTTLANREVTALLVQYRTPAAAAMLPRNINKTTNMMAASPAFELARLINLVGVGLDVVRAFGFVFILIAALSMFVGLYNALEARRFDLAILRTLGATRGQVFRTILVEGLVVAALGTALGLLLGHGVTEALGAWLKQKNQLELTGFTWLPAEFGLLGLALLVGGLSALVPAWRAYRSDIAETLARAS